MTKPKLEYLVKKVGVSDMSYLMEQAGEIIAGADGDISAIEIEADDLEALVKVLRAYTAALREVE